MKVGVITYHAAYNFGSCLQAYATAHVLQQGGYETKILNYRLPSQREYYQTIHCRKGIKRFLRDMIYIMHLRKMNLRRRRYEAFITIMPLTKEFNEPRDAQQYADAFDLYVSGSDQIWNKHSNELSSASWEYMDPYLLTFTSRPKISYASSVVNMRQEEISAIGEKLSCFHAISGREEDSAARLSEVIGRPCETVIDPTLLLSKNEWRELAGNYPKALQGKKYILYYALEGVRKAKENIPQLQQYAKQLGCELAVISPLSPLPFTKGIYNALDAGPREFLSLVEHAALVITNSYHGTMFSVNFQKPFYVIRNTNSKDQRIPHALALFGLQDRICDSVADLPQNHAPLDMTYLSKLESERNRCRAYFMAMCESACKGMHE